VLELTGVVIQDGVNLNAKFGYEKIFGWQLLNNKPFYFFKKNGLIQASYANEIIPLQYEELIHDRCCEQAVNNLQGDDAMVWYLAWRDGTWYYGELGVYP